MHFNERLWGKYAVWLDDSGYFYTKLPLGKNFIALLEYREGAGLFKNIPDNSVSIDLSLPDVVHYIGDISFQWSPSAADKRMNGGAVGVIAEGRKKGAEIPVSITASPATVSYFRRKFPDNKKDIITTLMTKAQ